MPDPIKEDPRKPKIPTPGLVETETSETEESTDSEESK